MTQRKKIKVGIFFGGPSREREISFAGGRTVYDNLNKTIFEPIPIFIDSNKKMILLDWQYVYKGTIRDFYPPVQYLPESTHGFQIYVESIDDMSPATYHDMISHVGSSVGVEELSQHIDVAFLALHGEYGEDGQIQAILESQQIPYTGSGLLPCALGMDKYVQKKLMDKAGFVCPTMIKVNRHEWLSSDQRAVYDQVLKEIGSSYVVRPANQGSSIGVSIVHEGGFDTFRDKVDAAFFVRKITAQEWSSLTQEDKVKAVRDIIDIRDGLGFPMSIGPDTIYHPEQLLQYLDHSLESQTEVQLESHLTESTAIIEAFITGKEFSCIVIRNESGGATALPPTEIRKQGQLYDYRSKYLPGLSRKITPIDLPDADIDKIRRECERLYDYLSFDTYARIDGFYTPEGEVILNDPNTTSGMMPSSFFFHQAAEIGLNPSQFLSFVIRASIIERMEQSLRKLPYSDILSTLDLGLQSLQQDTAQKQKVAVILGGYSFERHISVESGRNIYEKLASSDTYEPIPVFLMHDDQHGHTLHQIPINLLLKDNADDIADKISNYYVHPIISQIQQECSELSDRYKSLTAVQAPRQITYEQLSKLVDAAFIALHGRPGEDGEVQRRLKQVGIPHNGSPAQSAAITIDKYKTLQTLKQHGFTVADQLLISKDQYLADKEGILQEIQVNISYPLIAKPVDDGCSSAVRKIDTREELELYLRAIYRDEETMSEDLRSQLGLSYNEEFPHKDQVLIEELILPNGAASFMEITGGMLTHHQGGKVHYEVFEPSEALAGGEILSLEEKFLAGEGQNITPARFSLDQVTYTAIADQVKADLEQAAKILKVEGYCRIDAFVRIFDQNKVETIVIEVNSLPGMTPATCIFHQCAINGYKPYQFIDKILQYAINE